MCSNSIKKTLHNNKTDYSKTTLANNKLKIACGIGRVVDPTLKLCLRINAFKSIVVRTRAACMFFPHDTSLFAYNQVTRDIYVRRALRSHGFNWYKLNNNNNVGFIFLPRNSTKYISYRLGLRPSAG